MDDGISAVVVALRVTACVGRSSKADVGEEKRREASHSSSKSHRRMYRSQQTSRLMRGKQHIPQECSHISALIQTAPELIYFA